MSERLDQIEAQQETNTANIAPNKELWTSSTGFWLVKKADGFYNLFDDSFFAPLGVYTTWEKTGSLLSPDVDQFNFLPAWKSAYMRAVEKQK